MGCLVCPPAHYVRLLRQKEAGGHIKLKSHWNALKGLKKNGCEVNGGQAESKHLPFSFILSVMFSEMHSKPGLFPTYGWALEQLDEEVGVVEEEEEEAHWAVKQVWLLLLPLVSCF